MNILFYGFRHTHIDVLYRRAREADFVDKIYCIEEDTSAREAAAERLGITFEQKSYPEMLCDKSIDAVAIGGKYGERGKAVIAALKAGKHIISDKPLCTSLCELSEIRKLSEEKNLKIGCMLDLRYMPSAIAAKEIISKGILGQVRNISFDGQHYIDYARRPAWYFEEGMHGGTVNDLAIHGIDLVRQLTGLEFSKTDFVRTRNAYAVHNKAFRDCALFAARLGNGAEVMADTSYSAPAQAFSLPTYWQFRMWFEKGMMSFSINDNNVYLYEDGKEEQVIPGILPENNWLSDFALEISADTRSFTEGVLASTETALKIQAQAKD